MHYYTCPVGMIINPRSDIADQPPTVRDPSHLIYMVAEKRLLMTAYAAMHQTRTLIPIDSKSMNRVLIISLAAIPEQELSYNEPQAIYNPLKDTLMSKWLESIDDYLLKFWGVNKCPLSYVARTQISVKPHATDPDTDYEEVDQEMTPQSPHDQCIYCAENKTLWHILHDALKYHSSYTSIRSFARTHNGRSEYLFLVLHNLGESLNYTDIK